MKKRPFFGARTVIIGLLAVSSVFVLLASFWYLAPYDDFLKETAGISLTELIFRQDAFKEGEGRVNLLFLGRAGGDLAGSDLTDSIMAVVFDKNKRKAYTIALPRDIWSQNLQDKLNSAYFYGKQKGVGLSLVRSETAAIVGFPIHYVFVIDFDKFTTLIDYLGGVDIYVERSFDDFEYPIAGRADDLCGGDPNFRCRFEPLSFKKGLTHMDGATALKFARSRNSPDKKEGTDFARGRRQQKVITAIYQKIINRMKNPRLDQLRALYTLINTLLERDISNREAIYLLREIVLGAKIEVREVGIAEGYFIVPPYRDYGGKYVLVPRDGNFIDLQRYLQCIFGNQIGCSL